MLINVNNKTINTSNEWWHRISFSLCTITRIITLAPLPLIGKRTFNYVCTLIKNWFSRNLFNQLFVTVILHQSLLFNLLLFVTMRTFGAWLCYMGETIKWVYDFCRSLNVFFSFYLVPSTSLVDSVVICVCECSFHSTTSDSSTL